MKTYLESLFLNSIIFRAIIIISLALVIYLFFQYLDNPSTNLIYPLLIGVIVSLILSWIILKKVIYPLLPLAYRKYPKTIIFCVLFLPCLFVGIYSLYIDKTTLPMPELNYIYKTVGVLGLLICLLILILLRKMALKKDVSMLERDVEDVKKEKKKFFSKQII